MNREDAMSLVIEPIPSHETMFLLPMLLDADEDEERIRAALLIQPVPHMHLGWMVSLLELLSCAGRNKIPVKSCISRWLLLCEAVGMGSRSCKLYRTNCPDMEGVRYWLGRRMLHWRTLPSTRNAASACMRSDATILRIFSHLCWSTGSYFVICWCFVMTRNDQIAHPCSV